MTSSPVKTPSAGKSLCMFTNIFDVKKTAYRRVGAAKYKHKAIKYGNTPWELKKKLKRHSKISEDIRKSLYNWILHNPQFLKSTIAN